MTLVAEPVIGLFLEDIGHQQFVTTLVRRIASEVDVSVEFNVLNATGGIPRMRDELSRFLRQYAHINSLSFDLLIIVEDTDCRGEATVKNDVLSVVSRAAYLRDVIVASPDPHIESWYLADPNSLQTLLNSPQLTQIPRGDCEKDKYKRELVQVFRNSPLGGGIEQAGKLVENMDMYRAGCNVPSLGNFISEVRAKLRLLASNPR